MVKRANTPTPKMTITERIHSIKRFYSIIYDAYFADPQNEEMDFWFLPEELEFAVQRLKFHIKEAVKIGASTAQILDSGWVDLEYAEHLIDRAFWLASGDHVFYALIEQEDKLADNLFFEFDDMISGIVKSLKQIRKRRAK